MLLSLLIKLFCRVRFGSSKLHLRVYRVIDNSEGIYSASVVYEDIHRNLFLENGFFSDTYAHLEESTPNEVKHINSLLDAVSAIDTMRIDMPLEMNSSRWESEGGHSIDEAITKRRNSMEEILADMRTGDMRASDAGPEGMKQRELRAYISYKAEPAKEMDFEEEVRQLSKKLRRKAGGKDVGWKAVGLTPDGREYHILVIDGKGEHQVP